MNRDSKITSSGNSVFIDGKMLDPLKSQKVRNHSPDGFMWGYGGSGPSQLALALLMEATTVEEALKYYQDFKMDHVATHHMEHYTLDASVIYDWLDNAAGQTPVDRKETNE